MASPKSKAGKAKVAKVMHEWGQGKLHSGSKHGPDVHSQKQAVAIALSEARHLPKASHKEDHKVHSGMGAHKYHGEK